MPASVPELTKRTASTLGMILMTSSAMSVFALGDGAKRKARVDGGVHGFNHGRMVVAEDHRTPGADVIDVAATFGIPHVGAFGATDKARCAANALESAYGRIHAAGDALLSPFKKFLVDAHFLSNALNQ